MDFKMRGNIIMCNILIADDNKQIAAILANIVEESGANPYAIRTDKETGKHPKRVRQKGLHG